ncbi:MAG: nitrate/nitrite transporter NrtS [Chloroflexi bacterium]|nr:nitrate/nitrite transporter NrtS [Chloroflexota bacterium]
MYGPVCGRAISVALVVGTILVAINQGDVLLSGQLTALVAAKIGLTFMVPFSVSTYSALAANRLQGR